MNNTKKLLFFPVLCLIITIFTSCLRSEHILSAIPERMILGSAEAIEMDGSVFILADSQIKRFSVEENCFIPVCNLLNCGHRGNECLAYVNMPDMQMCFLSKYNHKLLFVSRTPENRAALYSMDPITCEREQVWELPEINTELPGAVFVEVGYMDLEDSVLIDVVPFYDPYASLEEVPEHSRTQRLLLLDLQSGVVTEPFKELLSENSGGWYAKCTDFAKIGEELYATLSMPTWDDKHNQTGFSYDVIRINCKTGKQKRIRVEDEFSGIVYSESAILYVQGDGSFVELDPNSGEKHLYDCSVERPQFAMYDDRLVILKTHKARREDGTEYGSAPYVFFDRGYQRLDELELPDGMRIAINTTDRLFFEDKQEKMYWLDKSKIGSGVLDLIPLGRDGS